MNAQTKPHDQEGPTPETLAHGEVVWKQPLRYERGSPVARREGLHERLVHQGKISTAQWLWATRYCTEWEALAGAREGKGPVERVDEGRREPIYDRRTAAAGFLRLAHGRMTKKQRELMDGACVMAYRLGDVAIMLGILPRDDETMAQFSDRVRERVCVAVVKAIEAGSGIVEVKPPLKNLPQQNNK